MFFSRGFIWLHWVVHLEPCQYNQRDFKKEGFTNGPLYTMATVRITRTLEGSEFILCKYSLDSLSYPISHPGAKKGINLTRKQAGAGDTGDKC